jgi:hypothetical protein
MSVTGSSGVRTVRTVHSSFCTESLASCPWCCCCLSLLWTVDSRHRDRERVCRPVGACPWTDPGALRSVSGLRGRGMDMGILCLAWHGTWHWQRRDRVEFNEYSAHCLAEDGDMHIVGSQRIGREKQGRRKNKAVAEI